MDSAARSLLISLLVQKAVLLCPGYISFASHLSKWRWR